MQGRDRRSIICRRRRCVLTFLAFRGEHDISGEFPQLAPVAPTLLDQPHQPRRNREAREPSRTHRPDEGRDPLRAPPLQIDDENRKFVDLEVTGPCSDAELALIARPAQADRAESVVARRRGAEAGNARKNQEAAWKYARASAANGGSRPSGQTNFVK